MGGAALGACYGLARIIPTTLGASYSYHRRCNPAPLTTWILRASEVLHKANGLALRVTAGVLVGLLVSDAVRLAPTLAASI